MVVMRKTGRKVTVEELERIDPREGREAQALYHDVLHLRAEVAGLRAGLNSKA
jgi:hypothetical protein